MAKDKRDECEFEPQVPERGGDLEVPRDEWRSFFENFSGQHRGWLATVEVAGPVGRLIVIEERRLQGLYLDQADGNERAYIQAGNTPEEHVTHTVEQPARIRLRQTKEGVLQGLEIASGDGSVTRIQFRPSNVLPEMLDGIVAA